MEINGKIKKEADTPLLIVVLYSCSQNCTTCKQLGKQSNHTFYHLFKEIYRPKMHIFLKRSKKKKLDFRILIEKSTF